MTGKENKRIVGLYNRLAKALLEFEGLWLRAWRKGLDFALQGLNAPLIVRHPDTGEPQRLVLTRAVLEVCCCGVP